VNKNNKAHNFRPDMKRGEFLTDGRLSSPTPNLIDNGANVATGRPGLQKRPEIMRWNFFGYFLGDIRLFTAC
jgi:hypothetical protein